MAVDRSGSAYIRDSDDSVFRVDLSTMTCSATGCPDRTTRFDSFGMGYATDSADTWRDQMCVVNENALGVLDTTSGTIINMGQLDKTTGATLTTLPLRSFPSPTNIDTFAFAT